MGYLKDKLQEFGNYWGFLPKGEFSDDLRADFAYVDPEIRDIAYQAKREIEDLYSESEGVIPVHWGKVNVFSSRLPSRLEWIYRDGKRVLNKVKGTLGMYRYGRGGGLFGWLLGRPKRLRNVYVNRNLLQLDDGGLDAKTTLKHELIHSIQDELGTLYGEPKWKTEAEASIFSEDGFQDLDFEATDRWFSYRKDSLRYLKDFGKKVMTSFKGRMKKYYEWFNFDERSELHAEFDEEVKKPRPVYYRPWHWLWELISWWA